jgi:small subunit ribosomal protein S11
MTVFGPILTANQLAEMAGQVRQRIVDLFSKSARASQRVRPDCLATVHCTLNNTHVCFSLPDGRVVAKSSGGSAGFKGPERGSADAAAEAARVAADKARAKGHEVVGVRLKGVTNGQSGAVASIIASGFKVASFEDITGFPTNGCRPRKTRRL